MVATPEPRLSEEVRVARSAGVVGAATMLSRVLGLVREQVMAGLFGAGLATDAFNVAFRIPNLLRDLFAEGAMSSAFVPTFIETQKREGDAGAWALGRQLFVALLLVLAALCVLGYVLAPALVRLLAPGFGSIPGKFDLTVLLTRILLPFLPIVALAAAAMGMLNARGRFAVPALAPAWLNVGMIGGGLALLPVMRAVGQPAILAMAIGVLLGGLAQFAFQLPSLRAEGFHWRVERPTHPGIRRVASLMAPATLGLSATQLNVAVSTVIASMLVQGSVSWLNFAFRLMQLPIGVFGVAISTVSLPGLSRAAADRDLPALKNTLSAALRLGFVLTVPAAMWLAVMAGPTIALLYEHGAFLPEDSRQTAGALGMYCLGLPAFAAVGVFTRAFYALGDTRVPVRASFLSVAVNLGLNLLFIGPLRFLGLGHLGLALATSATSIANLSMLAWALRRKIGPIGARRILDTLWRAVIAAALALIPSAGALVLFGDGGQGGWVQDALLVAGSLAASLVFGWFAMRVMRVEELSAIEALGMSLLRRRSA